jgi:hypothetical protein
MHYHHIEDDRGDLVDLVPFCCAACNQSWCRDNGMEYQGWNGCQEGSDYPEWCANCGGYAGGAIECEHQRNNVVVNRFLSEEGEKCSHGHWLQLPSSMLA